MTWFRSQRRRLSLLSALVLALQTLAVAAASHAHASAAAAEGSTLIMICTAQGVKVMDLNAPDKDPVPVGQHQCPLCIVGCASCATPAVAATLVLAAVIFYQPAVGPSAPDLQAQRQIPPPHLAQRTTSPRGPPALA